MPRKSAILRYALADVLSDGVAAGLTIALLVVVMSPPALLYAAKSSLISAWTEDIAQDASNREVVIRGGKASNEWITPEDIATIRAWPELGFFVPEPSFSVRAHEWAKASEDEMRPPQSDFRILGMRTTATGDPIFRSGPVPVGMGQVALSHDAASALTVDLGDAVFVKVTRQTKGRTEREYVRLEVVHVLPEAAWPRSDAFVSPQFARSIRAYQYHEIARNAFPAPVDMSEATWPSLRIYASSIHTATALRDRMREFGFDDTRLKTDQIERLLRVQSGIDSAFVLLLSMGVIGFLASLFLMEWLSVVRKTNDLGILVSIGFDRGDISLLRTTQTLLLIGSSLGVVGLVIVAAEGSFALIGNVLLGLADVNPVPYGHLALGGAIALLAGTVGALCATARIDADTLTRAIRQD